jgi:cytochrome c-type biogenesis protein CcmE
MRFAERSMHPVRKKRLGIIVLVLLSVSIGLFCALIALNQNINLFYTPSQVLAGEALPGHVFRVGGRVEEGSVKHFEGLKASFVIKDAHQHLTIFYEGILPALFREGQEIIVEGRLSPRGFVIADQVLAKHDETYAPRTR